MQGPEYSNSDARSELPDAKPMLSVSRCLHGRCGPGGEPERRGGAHMGPSAQVLGHSDHYARRRRDFHRVVCRPFMFLVPNVTPAVVWPPSAEGWWVLGRRMYIGRATSSGTPSPPPTPLRIGGGPVVADGEGSPGRGCGAGSAPDDYLAQTCRVHD